ncbi:MAG: hypothetical protein L0G05_02100, partial [Chryseobacterium sp.]|nr:hypothetical protein [Chryseobacterium sp.]
LSIFVKEILNTKVCLNLNISKTQQKLIKTQHMKKNSQLQHDACFCTASFFINAKTYPVRNLV